MSPVGDLPTSVHPTRRRIETLSKMLHGQQAKDGELEAIMKIVLTLFLAISLSACATSTTAPKPYDPR
jgi:hypothetical protein